MLEMAPQLPQPINAAQRPFAQLVRAIDRASWRQGTQYDGTPLPFATGAALALVSGLVGRYLRLPGDKPCNVYVMGVGQSGSGKDSVWQAVQLIVNKTLDDEARRAFTSRVGATDVGSRSSYMQALPRDKSMLQFKSEWARNLPSSAGRTRATTTRARRRRCFNYSTCRAMAA